MRMGPPSSRLAARPLERAGALLGVSVRFRTEKGSAFFIREGASFIRELSDFLERRPVAPKCRS